MACRLHSEHVCGGIKSIMSATERSCNTKGVLFQPVRINRAMKEHGTQLAYTMSFLNEQGGWSQTVVIDCNIAVD